MPEQPKRYLDLEKIQAYQAAFAKERDWDQFHNPKNLAMALAGEAGELLEIFQWLQPQQSVLVSKDPERRIEVEDELADILYYLLRIADKLDIDINEAFWKKTAKNEKKYPVHLAKGRATKYTEL